MKKQELKEYIVTAAVEGRVRASVLATSMDEAIKNVRDNYTEFDGEEEWVSTPRPVFIESADGKEEADI